MERLQIGSWELQDLGREAKRVALLLGSAKQQAGEDNCFSQKARVPSATMKSCEELLCRLASQYFLHTRNTAASSPKVVPLDPHTSLSAFYTRTSTHCRVCSALFRWVLTTRELRARVQSGELLYWQKHLVGAELKKM